MTTSNIITAEPVNVAIVTDAAGHTAVVSGALVDSGAATVTAVWNADGAASVSWTGHATVTATWNADGAASVSWTGRDLSAATWNADGAASVAWAGAATRLRAATWNADGAAAVSWGGYSTYWHVTWQADGSANVDWRPSTVAVWHADGAASVNWTALAAGHVAATWRADGVANVQFSWLPAHVAMWTCDGVAAVAWHGLAAGNAVWSAGGQASVAWTNSAATWHADGAASVAWTGHAIAAAAWNASGSAWVSWTVEAGPFYFAWIDYGETWGPQHLRIDQVVFACNLVHEEGQCATLELVVKNTFEGFLAFGRRQWAFFSLAGGALLKGRLLSIPSDMTGEAVTMHFTAMPLDMLDQQRLLADAMMVLPYWDPVWIDEAQRLDPQSVLEGYSRHWHVDRVTLVVSTSDLIAGEDGLVIVTEDDAFYDSVKPSIDKAPLLNVYVDATVNWVQYDAGFIDMGYQTWNAWAAGGMIGSWPKAGTDIGAGWYVKHSQAVDPAFEVKTQNLSYKLTNKGKLPNPFDTYEDSNGVIHVVPVQQHHFGDVLEFDMAISRPYLLARPIGYPGTGGAPVDTATALTTGSPAEATFVTAQMLNVVIGDEEKGVAPQSSASQSGINLYNWSVSTKLVIGYKAQRARTENVRFTLAADMQPVFSDPAEAGASGVAANFAQNSEYVQIKGLVGLEGPYGRFRGNWAPLTFYTQYDFFIVQVGPDTYAYQAQRDHWSLPFWDEQATASSFVPGWYDAGDMIYAEGTYWQILISGNFSGLLPYIPPYEPPGYTPPAYPPPSPPPGVVSAQGVTVLFDPYLLQPSMAHTGNPHAGRRLYQAIPQFRGNWLPNGEVMVAGDMVIAPDGTWYRVAIGHRTAASFYRFAIDPTGRLVYELMLNPPPIGDLRRRSYFPTVRGNQSLQNLIYRARAKIIARSRVLKIAFECRFELVMNSITLRKNVQLFDRRLPGGSVVGKVVSYGMKGDGDTGAIIGSVTIACTAGYGAAVEAAAGTPTYCAAAYAGNDYQAFDDVFAVLGTSDVSYQPPDDSTLVDDGLVFPLDYAQAVVSEFTNVIQQPIQGH